MTVQHDKALDVAIGVKMREILARVVDGYKKELEE